MFNYTNQFFVEQAKRMAEKGIKKLRIIESEQIQSFH